MSYTFSRRTFLKTSAVLAVAAATSGLLSGCEYTDPDNPVSTKLGTSLEIMQTTGTLNSIKEETGVFNFTIKSDYGIPLLMDPDNFAVMVKNADGDLTYYSLHKGGVKILDGINYPTVADGEKVTLNIAAPNFPALAEGDVVVFKYIPVRSDANYSMSWQITKETVAE